MSKNSPFLSWKVPDGHYQALNNGLPSRLSADAFARLAARLTAKEDEDESDDEEKDEAGPPWGEENPPWREASRGNSVIKEMTPKDFEREREREEGSDEEADRAKERRKERQKDKAKPRPQSWMASIRIASLHDLDGSFKALGQGLYRRGHTVWELRAAEDDDGGYVLARKREERAPELHRTSKVAVSDIPSEFYVGQRLAMVHNGEVAPVIVLNIGTGGGAGLGNDDLGGEEALIEVQPEMPLNDGSMDPMLVDPSLLFADTLAAGDVGGMVDSQESCSMGAMPMAPSMEMEMSMEPAGSPGMDDGSGHECPMCGCGGEAETAPTCPLCGSELMDDDDGDGSDPESGQQSSSTPSESASSDSGWDNGGSSGHNSDDGSGESESGSEESEEDSSESPFDERGGPQRPQIPFEVIKASRQRLALKTAPHNAIGQEVVDRHGNKYIVEYESANLRNRGRGLGIDHFRLRPVKGGEPKLVTPNFLADWFELSDTPHPNDTDETVDIPMAELPGRGFDMSDRSDSDFDIDTTFDEAEGVMEMPGQPAPLGPLSKNPWTPPSRQKETPLSNWMDEDHDEPTIYPPAELPSRRKTVTDFAYKPMVGPTPSGVSDTQKRPGVTQLDRRPSGRTSGRVLK